MVLLILTVRVPPFFHCGTKAMRKIKKSSSDGPRMSPPTQLLRATWSLLTHSLSDFVAPTILMHVTLERLCRFYCGSTRLECVQARVATAARDCGKPLPRTPCRCVPRRLLTLPCPMGRKKRRLGIDDAKLQDVLHTGGVSISGLAQLLKTLSDADDVPVEVFRKRLMTANKDEFRKHEFKIQLQLADGEPWTWSLLDPSTTLSTLLEKSKDLHLVYAHAWRRVRSSPESLWRLVVAFDEFTPGNKLNLDSGVGGCQMGV